MKIDIRFAKPGMVLSNAVINENNRNPIVNSDIELTEKIIEGLKRLNIKQIDVNLTQTQMLALEMDKEFEYSISPKLFDSSKKSIQNFDTMQIINNAQEMVKTIIQSDSFKYKLSDYKELSDIFSHSVRVAAFSVLLAKHYNDSLEENVDQTELEKMKINLENIATAAMIHDIGKLCKDKELLQRALSVKKYLVKSFPAINDLDLENYNDNYSSIYSCLLLFANTSLSPDIKTTVLLSSENDKGHNQLGLNEQQLKSKQSFVYASKIIKLCSIYDDELKLTISNNRTLENISAKLDYFAVNGVVNNELEKLFTEHIPLYSEGVKVKLSDGTFAIVEKSFYGRTDIYKPIVRTIPNFEVIDLRKELTLTIQEVCSDEISFYEIVTKQITTMQKEILDEKNKSIA